MARFVKTHPHMLVPQYNIAVWIDANILIRGDISGWIDDFECSGLPIAAVPHPHRTSVYAEAKECVRRGKDDAGVVEPQMERYRSAGFDGSDLIESNLLMYRLDHPQLAPFLSAWWAEIERGSRRDQLSLNYAMAQTGVEWFPLTQRPNSVRNHPALALLQHGSNPCPHVPKAAMTRYCDVMDERVARQADRPVDVVVCVHDALDVVKLCLDSVCANRNAKRHRLILVDDGSNEETRDWLRDFASRHDRVDLIRHEQAMGYTKAANAGLRATQSDMAVMLNSDTIVAGRWIEKLLDAAFSNAGVGIVGPLSSAASHQSIPNHKGMHHQTAINDLPAGYSVSDMNAWCERQAPAELVPRVPLVHGFCMALTRDVIEAVGYFDETHFPFGYGEENDYCFRAVDRGFSLAVATHTYVYHKKSQSYANDKRVALAHAGNMKVRDLHGTERFLRAVRSVDSNPHLERMRTLAWELFGGHPGNSESASAQAALLPATRSSVYGRKLLAILQADAPAGIGEALMASETALESASMRMLENGQRPLVSIVMPTHNRADVIADAIQSVVEQDYDNWQLFVCDDASTDNTESIVAGFNDNRIHYVKLPKAGAAAARNKGLAQAEGEMIAYLDSDNFWHPRYLSHMVLALLERPGHSAVYGNFIDYKVDEASGTSIKSFVRPRFDQERLLRRNYIDLNTFVHRRELYDSFGGFNEALTRRQDYDLIIKYTWLRDPLQTDELVALYQRNAALLQITTEASHDDSCVQIINDSISRYLAGGLPTAGVRQVKRVTILSWDLCRNHFSKPFAVAEALSESYDVQLVSFRFFDEEIFPPLKDVSPRFDTVYLPGPRFPEFFDAMDKAVEAIDGDVIYVVKPRLPSLGTALLANARRGTPIILEINDLETVVAAPKAGDRHRESDFDSVDLADAELLNPYSDPWSYIMDPIAKTLPVLATHNKFIDAHFGHRCLYMRNLKDEAVYDPALYDRQAVRAELGFAPDDRIILFGGMVRRHKGIYELIDLVERLDDARYKLLFVGSRVTPDQTQLVEKFGDRVRVLPPQDRVAMARINLAADLVILWLDPEVPASHAQMPYKATDALAMKTPIIANDISDLGDLARQGYLRLVEFGDWDAMAHTIERLFSDRTRTAAMCEAGRRLYLRQFSYAAARADFALMLHRVGGMDAGPLPASSAFARRFDEFRRTVTGAGADTAETAPAPLQLLKIDGYGEAAEDASIVALDVKALNRLSHRDPAGVAIVMPSIDTARALATARLLVRRAGMKATVFVMEDTLRQGFIRTLNATAARLEVKFVVYLAEDAFPGADWLKLAHDRLEHSGKGLLAFNDGKWKGRIAAFGMVRTEWVKGLYGGPVFHPGYEAHKADNELTAIARAQDMFVYEPAAALFEYDRNKVFADKAAKDPGLFKERFRKGFDGKVGLDKLAPLALDYRVPLDTGPSANLAALHASPVHFPEVSKGFDAEWEVVDAADGGSRFRSHDGIVVVMYATDPDKGAVTAEKLAKRAGADCRIIVVHDTKKEGMVAAINRASAQLSARYLVYLTQDAFPGLNWLHEACEAMQGSEPSLLGFNEGTGAPYSLTFAMVRTQWARQLYGTHLFCPRYRSPLALAELCAIAHSSGVYAYAPDAVMFEYARERCAVDTAEDWPIFRNRLMEGFDGLVPVRERKSWESRFGLQGRKPADMAQPSSAAQPARISTHFTNLRGPTLEFEARAWESGGDKHLTSTVTTLVAAAEEALGRGPYSVIDKTSLPPSGNRNDYWHPAPYWWPNPDTPDGLPFINRDGRRVPGTRLYEPDSDKYDRSRLQRVFDDSFVLSLAWKFTGRQDFSDHAANILKRFFLDPETRMTPHLFYAQVRMGHDDNAGSKSGIIEMKDLYYYLDAIRMMVQSGAIGAPALNQFECWLESYLDWLLSSPQGVQECKSPNNHGIYYDLQVASIAAFLGKQDVLTGALLRAQSRVDQHFAADGSQPRELKRNTSAHYCCFNLQGWINLAELAARSDVDLWSCRGKNGAGLADGARWLLTHMGKPWPYEQIDDFDTDRFLPILFALSPGDRDALRIPGVPKSRYHAKACFFPHDGIRPFWNLGSAHPGVQHSDPDLKRSRAPRGKSAVRPHRLGTE